jgi:hypothetical protein
MAASRACANHGSMNLTWDSHGPHLHLRRLTRRVGAAISEMNRAQRRLFSLRTADDRYPCQADVPPEDYAEFLLRTCGVLRHEPSASQRLAGKGIR